MKDARRGLAQERLEFGKGACDRISCLVPVIDGATTTSEWTEALWARFYTGASRQQRSSVERYSIEAVMDLGVCLIHPFLDEHLPQAVSV